MRWSGPSGRSWHDRSDSSSAVAIGRRVRVLAARRGGNHRRGLRGTCRDGAALHEGPARPPPSDGVDSLRQGTGDGEHEPGRASVRRAKNYTGDRLAETAWRGGHQKEVAKDGTACLDGNSSPAVAPGSERSCSGLASGCCFPPCGACGIAERIVSLQPPGGRNCWGAHHSCNAEASGAMSSGPWPRNGAAAAICVPPTDI